MSTLAWARCARGEIGPFLVGLTLVLSLGCGAKSDLESELFPSDRAARTSDDDAGTTGTGSPAPASSVDPPDAGPPALRRADAAADADAHPASSSSSGGSSGSSGSSTDGEPVASGGSGVPPVPEPNPCPPTCGPSVRHPM